MTSKFWKVVTLFRFAASVAVLCTLQISAAASPVRPTTKEVLQQRGFDTSLPTLQAMAIDQSEDVMNRILAIRVIGETSNSEHTNMLVDLLADQQAPIRAAAAQSLFAIAGPNVVDHLILALDRESEPMTAMSLVSTLQQIGGPKAIEVIVEISANTERDYQTRLAALMALDQSTTWGVQDYKNHRSVIDALLGDPNSDLRASAAILSSRGGNAMAVKYLIEASLNDKAMLLLRFRAAEQLEQSTNTRFGLFESFRTSPRSALNDYNEAKAKLEAWWAEHQDEYN